MAKRKQYLWRRKRGGGIPFGYEIWDEDPQLLKPVPEDLALLDQALKHLRAGCSFRDTADWLQAVSGKDITHAGLRHRFKSERTNGWKKGYLTTNPEEGYGETGTDEEAT